MSALIFGHILLLFLWGTSGSAFGNLFEASNDSPGTPINITDAPFMAFVPEGGCTAVIVHNRFLVVRGSCVLSLSCDEGIKKVLVGEKEEYGVEKVIINPRFLGSLEFKPGDRDIALIKLNKTLTWSDNVQAAVVPNANFELRDGDRLRAVSGQIQGDNLTEINLVYRKQETCKSLDFIDNSEEDIEQNCRTLCAVGNSDCSKMKTGMLFLKNTLVGLPWPDKVCLNQTLLFSRVSEFHSFITKTIKENL